MDLLLFIPIFSGLSALAFAGYLSWATLKRETGTDTMKEISNAILVGANTFLKRMHKSVAIFVIILATLFWGRFGPRGQR